jgi:pilus assembly protein CpaF
MWQVRKPRGKGQEAPATSEDMRLVTVGDAGAFANRDAHTDLKVELHQRLLDLINLSALDQMSRAQIEDEVGDIVAEELAKQDHALNSAERKQIVSDVLDELLGLGPLEPLLKDPTITDILVNGHNHIFVERYGQLEPTPTRFKDEKHLLRIIQKIVSAVGRRIDESAPLVDARLADGSRVNAVVPPLALDG